MVRIGLGYGLCVLLAGCYVPIKTAKLPPVAELHDRDLENLTKTQVDILLGTPQSSGLHRIGDEAFALCYYEGLMGLVNALTGFGNLDSGTALITSSGDEVKEVLYWFSQYSGPKVGPYSSLSYEALDPLMIDATERSEIVELLGEPNRIGRRYHAPSGLVHDVLFYDGSTQKSKQLTEEWLIVGFDDAEVLRDLFWVSGVRGDLEEFGSVEEQGLRNLIQLDHGGMFPISRLESISTSSQLDAVRVEALLSTQPHSIDQVEAVLGPPHARGIRAFRGEQVLIAALWSSLKADSLGSESWPVQWAPERRSARSRPSGQSRKASYQVVEQSISRLIVLHDESGGVQEVMWMKPHAYQDSP